MQAQTTKTIIIVTALALAAAFGFWVGRTQGPTSRGIARLALVSPPRASFWPSSLGEDPTPRRLKEFGEEMSQYDLDPAHGNRGDISVARDLAALRFDQAAAAGKKGDTQGQARLLIQAFRCEVIATNDLAQRVGKLNRPNLWPIF